MIRANKILLSVCVCLTVGLLPGHAQNMTETPGPNAPLPETLAWLKAHIPYSYVAPLNKERGVLQRQTIAHVQTKGCTLSYDITNATLETQATAVDGASRVLDQQRWQIKLKGLNPRMIKVEPPRGDRPAQISFSSFDPGDPEFLAKIEAGKAFVAPVVPNKTIWHSDLNGDYRVRNGEGFVSWRSFFVRDEIKGQEIVTALKHAIGLCQ